MHLEELSEKCNDGQCSVNVNLDSIQILNYDVDGKIILQFWDHLDMRYFAALLQQASIILKSAHIQTSQADFGPRLPSIASLGSSGLSSPVDKLSRELQRVPTGTRLNAPLQQLRVSQESVATSQSGRHSYLSTLNNSNQVTNISGYVSPYEVFSNKKELTSFTPYQSSPLRNDLTVNTIANGSASMCSQRPPSPSTVPPSEGLTGSQLASYQADHLESRHGAFLPHTPDQVSFLDPTQTRISTLNTSTAAAPTGSNDKRYDKDALPAVKYLPFNKNVRKRSMSESATGEDSGQYKSALLAGSHRNTSFNSRLRVHEEAEDSTDQQVPDHAPLPSYKPGKWLTHREDEILQTGRAKAKSRTREGHDDSEKLCMKTVHAMRQPLSGSPIRKKRPLENNEGSPAHFLPNVIREASSERTITRRTKSMSAGAVPTTLSAPVSLNQSVTESQPATPGEAPFAPTARHLHPLATKQRSVKKACDRCKRLHKRCSGYHPCQACIDSGVADQCQLIAASHLHMKGSSREACPLGSVDEVAPEVSLPGHPDTGLSAVPVGMDTESLTRVHSDWPGHGQTTKPPIAKITTTRSERRTTRSTSVPKPDPRGRKLKKKHTRTSIKEVASKNRKASGFEENGHLDEDQRGSLSSRPPRWFKKQRANADQLPTGSLIYQEDDKENKPLLKQAALASANDRRRSARIAERVESNISTQREEPRSTNRPDLRTTTDQKKNTDRKSPGDSPSIRGQRVVGELSSKNELSGGNCLRTLLLRSQVSLTVDKTREVIKKPCSGRTGTPSGSTHRPIDPSHYGIDPPVVNGQESPHAAECILTASKPSTALSPGPDASKTVASVPHVHHQVAPRSSTWMHPRPRIQTIPVFSPSMVKQFSDLARSFIEQLREDLGRGLDPQMVYTYYDSQLIQAQDEWCREKLMEQHDVDLETKNTLMKQYNEDASRGVDDRNLRHYYSWHLAAAQDER